MKLLYVVFMTLVALSCQRAENKASLDELSQKVKTGKTNLADSTAQMTEDHVSAENNPPNEKQDKPQSKPATPQVNWTQKIIKTANVSLELKDYHSYDNAVHQSLVTYGAYIAQEQQ